jgi:hypothetical protein
VIVRDRPCLCPREEVWLGPTSCPIPSSIRKRKYRIPRARLTERAYAAWPDNVKQQRFQPFVMLLYGCHLYLAFGELPDLSSDPPALDPPRYCRHPPSPLTLEPCQTSRPHLSLSFRQRRAWQKCQNRLHLDNTHRGRAQRNPTHGFVSKMCLRGQTVAVSSTFSGNRLRCARRGGAEKCGNRPKLSKPRESVDTEL